MKHPTFETLKGLLAFFAPALLLMPVVTIGQMTAVPSANAAADTTRPNITITSPANSSTVPAGTILVKGTASDSSGIQKVEAFAHTYPFNYVWPFQMATPKAPGDWSAWSISLNVQTLGEHRILARATDKAGNENWYEVHINVVAKDTTRPTITITSPANDSTLPVGTILVKGTASDSSGIQKVEAFAHTYPFNYVWPFQMATPKAPGDWSAWSISLNVQTLGEHRILARATDKAGNENWYEVHINVVSSSSTNLYDDFNGQEYVITDGQTSPDGKWYSKYAGYGKMGVNKDSSGRSSFYQYVKSATDPSAINPDQSTSGTHSALALSTKKFGDMEMSVDIKTVQQMATRDPNTWETAWVFWRFADDRHHYYFVLKTNGYEFGKKDNNENREAQVFLKTGSSPKAEIDKWYNVKIQQIGKHVTIWVDNVKVVDMDDPTYNSSQMSSGAIGLYNEDASVRFDNVYVKPL